MNHIIDLILIAFILLIMFNSAKRGIVLTLFDIVAGIVSIMAGKLLSERAADYIYENFVRESVQEFLSEQLSEIEGNISDVISDAMSLFDFLPEGALTFLEDYSDFDSDTFSREVLSGTVSVAEIESEFASPIVLSLLQLITFAVIAALVLLVFKIFSRIVHKFISHSKIADGVDTVLGGVFGIAKGGIYACVLAAIINVISCTSSVLAEYTSGSYICAFVAEIIGV